MTPLYAGVGGVVRELTEMYTGINGVVTPLTEMWAGVGGVERQIFSGGTICTVSITGKGSTNATSMAQVEINGEIYYAPATLEIAAGTNMIASARCNGSVGKGGIYVNEEMVTRAQEGVRSYEYVIEKNISVNLISVVSGRRAYGEVYINEE